VALYDEAPYALEAALPPIVDNLAAVTEAEIFGDVEVILLRIRLGKSLSDAIVGADYVQKNVIKDLGVKRAIFRNLDIEIPDR